jgi:hypothetical protein
MKEIDDHFANIMKRNYLMKMHQIEQAREAEENKDEGKAK